MAEIINGKEIASRINEKVKAKITDLSGLFGRKPRLVSLIVEGSSDAEIYVNMQRRTAESVGIEFVSVVLPVDIDEKGLGRKIKELNDSREVTSIIIQKPLPKAIDHDHMVSLIRPEKDGEGLHPLNLGKILRKEADIVPCTPGAIMKILDEKKVDLYGKEVVLIGHSAIVGKPLSLMLLNEMATTTVCHLGTFDKGDIKGHAQRADILVVAVGKPGFIGPDWVSEKTIVIDVGINKVKGGITGDVDFEPVLKKVKMITPVPGGVGPVTVSILMRNVMRAFIDQNQRAE